MTQASPRRGRFRRLGWQGAVAAAIAALALLLAQSTAGAVFTTTTADGANQVTTKASFCTAPGPQPAVGPSMDTSIYQASPGTSYGTSSPLGTVSTSGSLARALLEFPLTSPGTNCTLTGASLQLWVASTTTVGRSIDVFQVAPGTPWSDSTVTWNNFAPLTTTTGTAVSKPVPASGYQVWDVTPLAQAMYAGTNNGFQVRDSAENTGGATVTWNSNEAASNKPQLVLTWG